MQEQGERVEELEKLELFCFAKTFTKNTSFFGKAFFSKERFELKILTS